MWKWISLVLTTLLAAGALVSASGRAFFVTRSEYTEAAQDEAVSRESMRGAVDRLNKAMDEQAAAFRALAVEVQGVKLDLAVLKKNR